MSRRVKVSLVSLAGLVLSAVALVALLPVAEPAAATSSKATQQKFVLPPPHPDRHGVPFISGADNPELIPDAVAYRLFLRMLMPADSLPDHAVRQRTYVRHVLRMGAALADSNHTSHEADTCATHKGTEPTAEEIEAVVRFVRTYAASIQALDARRRALGHDGQLLAAQALQADLDSVVASARFEMSTIVGVAATEKINRYVLREFKKKTKIFLPASSTTLTQQ